MEAIYRIYDTIEKRHTNDVFLDTKGYIYMRAMDHPDPVEDKDRYIVERSTGLYDKNKVLIYENDIITNNGKDKYAIILDKAQYIAKNINVSGSMLLSLHTRTDIIEVIGHALRDSHLLEG